MLGGQILSAFVGCTVTACIGTNPIALALAVGLAIIAMYLTHSMHPPGGATALIAIHEHATWLFPLMPVAVGTIILVAIAVVANNIVNHRQYPKHWW